jgi:hypothetical protein
VHERGRIEGWEAVTMTAGGLAVTVLPGKGADIYSLVDAGTGVDILFKAPWGLQPPGAAPREGSDGAPFLENYEGTWQELFPNTNDPCTVDGRELPFHGEVATAAWDCEEDEDDGGPLLRLAVDCPVTPLRLERVMRLRRDRPRLELDETVVSRSERTEPFVWGHHCVLGPPLVGEGATLRTSARTIMTVPEMWEETARLVPGQRSAWPYAELRWGGQADLSRIPGPDMGSHDDVYLTDLDAGWAEVENRQAGLRVRMEWDARVFPWIISWQPYGGARAMPLAGAYALGVEPWVSGGNLAEAVAGGTALEVGPRERFSTQLAMSVDRVS